MDSKSTDELLNILNAVNSVSDLKNYTISILQNTKSVTFPQYIEAHMSASGMTAAQLIEHAQLQRNYGYQILNGTRNAGRDKVIALCLALSLSISDTQRALTLAHESVLYPKNKRDSIIIFCINKRMTVLETNHLLYTEGESIL